MFPESKSPFFFEETLHNPFAKLSKLAKICPGSGSLHTTASVFKTVSSEERGPLANVYWHCWSSVRSGHKSNLTSQAQQAQLQKKPRIVNKKGDTCLFINHLVSTRGWTGDLSQACHRTKRFIICKALLPGCLHTRSFGGCTGGWTGSKTVMLPLS